jgi:hypothetical protein
VQLTVTDPVGQAATRTQNVTVSDAPAGTLSFRAVAASNVNTSAPQVAVPSEVQAGDALVLLATTNSNVTMSTPAGWSLLGTQLDGTDLKSWLFTTTASAGAGGSTVRMSLNALAKTSLTLLAYSDAGPVTTFASAAEAVTRTNHTTPGIQVIASGAWVVSHWVDKSSENRGWTLPATVTRRNANVGTGAGSLSAVTGDSGPVSSGSRAGSTATSGIASGKAIMWSIVIPRAN